MYLFYIEASRKRPLEDTTDGGPITKKQPSDEPEYSHTPGMPNPKLIAQAAISRYVYVRTLFMWI